MMASRNVRLVSRNVRLLLSAVRRICSKACPCPERCAERAVFNMLFAFSDVRRSDSTAFSCAVIAERTVRDPFSAVSRIRSAAAREVAFSLSDVSRTCSKACPLCNVPYIL